MAVHQRVSPVLRYPGGKQRLLRFLSPYLPRRDDIQGRYVEPFVGGGAVFLYVHADRAVLSDSNHELIDLYRGIKIDAGGVWRIYQSFGGTKEEYHRVRAMNPHPLTLQERTARLLYLNRTCFKGNWRHNSNGHFNVGYGGQSRRWVLSFEYRQAVGSSLRVAEIRCCDFEIIVDLCGAGDYLFIDPPYRPAERELINDHYAWKHFTFEDHTRLAQALRRATDRGARWAMTTSGHTDITHLFRPYTTVQIPGVNGTGTSGQVLILSEEVNCAKVL